MNAQRCDECGQFCTRLYDVPSSTPAAGIDHEACGRCRPDLAEVKR